MVPLSLERARIADGFWGRRQAINATVSLPHARAELERAGALQNLRHAAAGVRADHLGEINQDAEVYKWLEAASCEVVRAGGAGIRTALDEVAELVARAQEPGGYLHTWYQVTGTRERFAGLRDGGADELYTGGHLIQAAIAHHSATNSELLLSAAQRFVEMLEADFVGAEPDGVPGHSGIEMALVELYRLTGRERYLDLARHFVLARGNGYLGSGRFGASHYQDHRPVSQSGTLTGHAVAALYLACGAADVAIETGDRDLLAALERQWAAVAARRTHITGGVGSRHKNEDFGADYELSPDRAYCETCAAVAGVMWNWRLLLATGHARYAEAIERILFNGLLAGVSLDGRRFSYVNPLQVRGGHVTPADEAAAQRAPWFELACCPPNLMRVLASLGSYLATTSAGGLQLHQYASAAIDAPRYAVNVATAYPEHGRVDVTIVDGPPGTWELALRVPSWAVEPRMRVAGETLAVAPGEYARLRRPWPPGTRVRLDFGMPPRFTEPHPRVDALRGCVALERGPLVYCFEQVDQPCELADLLVERGALTESADADLGVIRVQVPCRRLDARAWGDRLYRAAGTPRSVADAPVAGSAIPYYAWGNRGGGPMRVWTPTTDA